MQIHKDIYIHVYSYAVFRNIWYQHLSANIFQVEHRVFTCVYKCIFSDSAEDKSQVNICVNYACKVIPKMFPLKSKICQPVFNLFMKQVALVLRVDNGIV